MPDDVVADARLHARARRGPVPISTQPASSPGNLLDFKGDLLGGPLGKPATSVSVTAAAYKAGELTIALDINLAFSPGTATGHLYATHCASLDEP